MSFDASGIADLWRCPKSHSELIVDGDSAVCVDADCRLRFEIRDGIPVMLIDEAVIVSPEELAALIARQAAVTTAGQ